MYDEQRMLRYEAECSAERVIKILGKRKRPGGDERFTLESINGQMQELYLAARERGINMKKQHLTELWMSVHCEAYRINSLRRERSQLLRQQANLARRIKQLSEVIAKQDSV